MSVRKIALLLLLTGLLYSCSTNEPNEETNPTTTVNLQPLGTSANELLSADVFSSMTVEIAYPENFRPTEQTLSNVRDFLESHLNKPGGIQFVETVLGNLGDGTKYSIEEIRELEAQERTLFTEEDDIAVWLFFANESSAKDQDNSVVLGTAYQNTSIVIFQKTIENITSNSTRPVNKTLLETTTINHEFGHLLGLVDLGSEPQSDHEDQDNPRHCVTEDCLMYFQTVANVFLTDAFTEAPALDDFCLADLRANGGK
ncbi:membrane metalloprotease [Croceiramulus getboli]|nr:membrane metalloprotease [Flavobacteriaceae bacterium YJPT1-3]